MEATNPAVSLTIPARITQAADDQRVKANPPAPLKGTDQLITELRDKNTSTGAPLIYQRYPKGEANPDAQFGVHFATINHRCMAKTLFAWPGVHIPHRQKSVH